jgi:hypothetical protein
LETDPGLIFLKENLIVLAYPWQQYFTWLALNWSWWLFPLLFFYVIAARRHWILALLALVIILSHSFLGHKEYRFIFPALPLIIILAGLGTATLVSRLSLVRGSSSAKLSLFFSSLSLFGLFYLGCWRALLIPTRLLVSELHLAETGLYSLANPRRTITSL